MGELASKLKSTKKELEGLQEEISAFKQQVERKDESITLLEKKHIEEIEKL